MKNWAFGVAVATAAVCFSGAARAGDGDWDKWHTGTTLTACKTAEGVWKVRRAYDWTIEKSADPREILIPRHHHREIDYTISVTRGAPHDSEIRKIKGEVCVNNQGHEATENLTIIDQLQARGQEGWEDIPGASVTISPQKQLEPFQSQCYSYEIPGKFEPGVEYRNVAHVTITNWIGCSGKEWGTHADRELVFPANPEIQELDTTATVKDQLSCPQGFECEGGDQTYHLTGSDTLRFKVKVENECAKRHTIFSLTNTATLTTDSTHGTHAAQADVEVHSSRKCFLVHDKHAIN